MLLKQIENDDKHTVLSENKDNTSFLLLSSPPKSTSYKLCQLYVFIHCQLHKALELLSFPIKMCLIQKALLGPPLLSNLSPITSDNYVH